MAGASRSNKRDELSKDRHFCQAVPSVNPISTDKAKRTGRSKKLHERHLKVELVSEDPRSYGGRVSDLKLIGTYVSEDGLLVYQYQGCNP